MASVSVCVSVCVGVCGETGTSFFQRETCQHTFWKTILQYVSIFIKKAIFFDLMASRKLSK